MRSLDMFTMGELVAVMILVLQLILVAVVLRDKRLWRIRRTRRRPRAARAQAEEQSSVDRAQESADTSPGSSRRSSMCYRKHFPRFIRSSQDTWALFEEQCRELEAHLAQWQWEQGPFPVVQTEVPGLLRVRKSGRRLGVKLPRLDMGKGTEEDTREDTGQRSGSSAATAWSLPREGRIFSARGLECGTRGRTRPARPSPWQWGLGVRQRGTGPGRGLLQRYLRQSSLGRSLMHLWARHIQRRRRRRVRFATPLVTVQYFE
ncbi:uncharacterized protein LOC116782974 [Chiroxiphia lanceolata]|uniref:uncharacterized protein LOC116782974 n=1 Tax=Chiroxiphia lanceolata TaxID=296741 RepID=UPI0013CF2C52|nr:uncharacterized protein LOC116782974 [Chiroxiphia lanceolata]